MSTNDHVINVVDNVVLSDNEKKEYYRCCYCFKFKSKSMCVFSTIISLSLLIFSTLLTITVFLLCFLLL